MIPDAANKHLFYTEMAKLLEAGFDIRKAAGVMADTRLPAAQAKLLETLNAGLEAGETIAGAFSRDAKTVGKLEKSMIAAGERGGKLAPAFGHLAGYFGMVAAARREAIKGMIYPLVVLHLGVFVGTVPMAMMGGEASAGGMVGDFFKALGVIYVGVVIVYFVIRALRKKAPQSAVIDRAINHVPWIGNARRDMAMSRFCKVYHACLLAGISMMETVRVSSDAAQSGQLMVAGKRLLAVAEEGNLLGPQFLAEDAFPKSFARSYAIGEEAGTLDKDMATWARLFQENADGSMRTASLMIPKILYFVVMGYVAWKIVGFFNGYYGALDAIGE
ncbi:MAG: type II secretion system F family protein [Akkermansiaceae bacterium]|nr:type II secretion system F family protein [Akkermansiaceae bacterium]